MKKIKKAVSVILAVVIGVLLIRTPVFAYVQNETEYFRENLPTELNEEVSDIAQEPLSEENNIPASAPEAEETSYGTGVYLVDGIYTYYENGVPSYKTGVVRRVQDQKDVYVEKGIFREKNGVAKRLADGKWVYVRGGVFEKSTGAAKRLTDNKIVYVKNGVFNKATGIVPAINGKPSYYVKKGVFKKYTGLVRNVADKKWGFVRKGKRETNPDKMTLTAKDRKAGRKETFVQVYAETLCAKITTAKMTKQQKLRACFRYASDRKHYKYRLKRIPHYYGKDWPVVYAFDMIQDRSSVCLGYAALFGYLARACGYKAYCCYGGYHAWVEINGKVYDPSFAGTKKPILIYGLPYKTAVKKNPDGGYEGLFSRKGKWGRIKVPD